MKKVSKIIIFLILMIIIIPKFALAESAFDKASKENQTQTNPDLLVPESVKKKEKKKDKNN